MKRSKALISKHVFNVSIAVTHERRELKSLDNLFAISLEIAFILPITIIISVTLKRQNVW